MVPGCQRPRLTLTNQPVSLNFPQVRESNPPPTPFLTMTTPVAFMAWQNYQRENGLPTEPSGFAEACSKGAYDAAWVHHPTETEREHLIESRRVLTPPPRPASFGDWCRVWGSTTVLRCEWLCWWHPNFNTPCTDSEPGRRDQHCAARYCCCFHTYPSGYFPISVLRPRAVVAIVVIVVVAVVVVLYTP